MLTTATREPPSATARLDWYVLLPPLAAAVLFASGNVNFGFDPPGYLDSFVYVGYFWHYPEHLPLFDSYYKISRLPWILPGFAAHRLFGEMAGTFLLQWATLSASGIGLYLLIRDGFRDRTVAALLGVAWVCLVLGEGVGGWNYHMQAATAYHFFASWFAVRAGRSEARRFDAFVAGAALACAIHTNLLAILFAPLLAMTYAGALPNWAPGMRRRMAIDAVRASAGGIGITVLLAAINAGTGGVWLFFMPQIEYSQWIAGHNDFHMELSAWLPGALYLVIPLIAILAAGATALRAADQARRFSVAVAVQGCLALAICIYCQTVRRQSVLDHDYIGFGLYNYAFPALAVMLVRQPVQSQWIRERGLAVGLAAVIVGTWLYGRPNALLASLVGLLSPEGARIPPILIPLAAGFASVLAVSALPRRAALLGFALWFGLLNAWVSGDHYGSARPGVRRSMLALYAQLDRFTTKLDPSLLGIKYWFPNEPIQTPEGQIDLSSILHSYVATRGWAGNLLSQQSPLPRMEELKPKQLLGPCVGLLSSTGIHEGLRADFIRTFLEQGETLRPVADGTFTSDGLIVTLTVLKRVMPETATTPDASRPPCLP